MRYGFIILLIPVMVWAQEQATPRKLIVPEDYPTIQQALDQAKPDDTVFVKNGVYTERVRMRNRVHLVGESRDGVVIQQDMTQRWILTINDCEAVWISDMTFQRMGDPQESKEKYSPAISGYLGHVELVRCRFVRPGDGAFDSKGVASLVVKDCIIEHCAEYGLLVGGSPVQIENCQFNDCGKHAIFLHEASGQINNVQIDSCKEVGICLKNSLGDIQVKNSTIDNCITGGIRIVCFPSLFKPEQKADRPRITYQITGNHISDQGQYGLYLSEVNSRLEMENNTITVSKKDGIWICPPTVDSDPNGITASMIDKDYLGEIVCQNNKIEKCKEYGVRLYGAYDVNLENNRVKECGKYAIATWQPIKKLSIKGNTCQSSEKEGIFVSDLTHSNWSVCNNTVQEAYSDGIAIYGCRKGGLVAGNICSQNRYAGIAIIGSEKIEVKDNSCRQNYYAGLRQENGSSRIEHNQFIENQHGGLVADGANAQLEIMNNTCTNNNQYGIGVEDGAFAIIRDNICQNNSWAGIGVRGINSRAEIINNKVTGNGAWGIIAWAGGWVDKQENNLTDNNPRGGVNVKPAPPAEIAWQWRNKAWQAWQDKKYDVVIHAYWESLKLDPNSYTANFWLGQALLECLKKDSAKGEAFNRQAWESFKRALAIVPASVEARNGAGRTAFAMTEYEPRRKDYWLEESFAYYKHAYGQQPSNRDTIIGYAWVLCNKYYDRGKYPVGSSEYQLMVEMCRIAMGLLPDNPNYVIVAGCDYIQQAHQQTGAFRDSCLNQAETLFLRLDKKPVNELVHYNLACVYALQGQEDKCRQRLEILKQQNKLPAPDEVRQDRDLESVKDKPWFEALFSEADKQPD